MRARKNAPTPIGSRITDPGSLGVRRKETIFEAVVLLAARLLLIPREAFGERGLELRRREAQDPRRLLNHGNMRRKIQEFAEIMIIPDPLTTGSLDRRSRDRCERRCSSSDPCQGFDETPLRQSLGVRDVER